MVKSPGYIQTILLLYHLDREGPSFEKVLKILRIHIKLVSSFLSPASIAFGVAEDCIHADLLQIAHTIVTSCPYLL